MRTGLALAALAVVGAAATACSAGSGASTPSSSVAPIGIPSCADVYGDGADIVAGEFGAACLRDNGSMVTPLPISVECGDDRTLMWNDLAWGYMGETMTLTAEDEVDRVPPDELSQCLAGEGGPGSGVPSTTVEDA
ncbi:MAG TPA: hypothetical protein VKA65_09165 [Acidimicrobiales bacterium]|nr:hypothetical protein [Acidimicrobiales bacterium]HKH24890.1 hypothetical protein [Acidimicrobiales bacterium]